MLPNSRSCGRALLIALVAAMAPVLGFAAPPAPAKPADAAAEKWAVLLVPPVALDAVRPLYEKRIAKSLQDALAFSSRFELLTDADRAEAPPPPKGKAVQVKGSPSARLIDAADLQRQEGTDLAAEGKHAAALQKLRSAIAGYERAYLELVDYTKLADALARAGLAAFSSGAGPGEAGRLFAEGIALQPTLVIDRRKQPKELLDLFDAAHERLSRDPKAAISIEGDAPGAEAFVDGVRVGPLPARRADLPPGTHYVQLRGEGWQPWGQIVRLHGKDVRLKARPKAIQVAAPARPAEELTVGALEACSRSGAFHAAACRGPGVALAKQTGAKFMVFSAIKADKYSRLSLHPFLMEGSSGATIALKPVDLASDLGDVNAKAAALEADLTVAAQPFAKARALTKAPGVYKKP